MNTVSFLMLGGRFKLSETRERLKEAMKAFMKEKNRVGLSAVRMMLSAIQKKEKERRREDEIKEEEVIAVVSSYQKQLKESLEGLERAGRDTSTVLQEMEVVKRFLPEQLSEEEIEELVKSKIEELSQAGGRPRFGDVMKVVMAEVKGKADGRTVSEMVKRLVG